MSDKLITLLVLAVFIASPIGKWLFAKLFPYNLVIQRGPLGWHFHIERRP